MRGDENIDLAVSSRQGCYYFYLGSSLGCKLSYKYSPNLLFTFRLLGITTGMLKWGYYSDTRFLFVSNRTEITDIIGNPKKKVAEVVSLY